jgi:hypothetical protein
VGLLAQHSTGDQRLRRPASGWSTGRNVHTGPQPSASDLRDPTLEQRVQPAMQVGARLGRRRFDRRLGRRRFDCRLGL